MVVELVTAGGVVEARLEGGLELGVVVGLLELPRGCGFWTLSAYQSRERLARSLVQRPTGAATPLASTSDAGLVHLVAVTGGQRVRAGVVTGRCFSL